MDFRLPDLAGVAEAVKSWLLAGLLASILAGFLAGLAWLPAFFVIVFMWLSSNVAISGVPAHPMQHMQATRLPGSRRPASLATLEEGLGWTLGGGV